MPDDSAIGQWHKVFWKSGEMMGQTFRILEEDIQRTGMAKAGFVNLNYNDLKCPFGGWPRDKKLKTIGQMHQLVFEQDPEGKFPSFLFPSSLSPELFRSSSPLFLSICTDRFFSTTAGWLLYLWSSVLGWSHDSIRVYVKQARRQMNTDRMYIKHRVVWAQKPEGK